ncbi:MAG TPA: hypothetical protein VHW64_05540 [Nocardioides sp.]|jgi:hypothetical protein|uniref:hypothetical protein n=1 Tax=Nocardioides sp. TaxID=35761 RepID=UPI002E363132|nr:hypothetical protein [Nocardioides sp.]HEX3930144.1 hypothetical protein [Nocardioides sp.]
MRSSQHDPQTTAAETGTTFERVPDNPIPVLIYLPGLGRSAKNTADTVADMIAKSLDLRDSAHRFTAEASHDVVTPTGLTASKTVLGPDRKPVLQLFQLDYRAALEESPTAFAPSVGPGAIKAGFLALQGILWWVGALRRPAKTARTKLQLVLGLSCALALVVAALVAFVALLTTLGLQVGWLDKTFGAEDKVAAWTLGISSLGLTITWAKLRKDLLALALLTESLIRFAKNEDVLADTITRRLDHAVNDLTDGHWIGPIHLLGYSFGSLATYEAMFPRTTSLVGVVPAQSIDTMVTIGCPLDLVRLYAPEYVDGRAARNPGLAWTNVFNQADVFASNLKDGDDTGAGAADVVPTGGAGAADDIATGRAPESVRYLDQEIAVRHLLLTGHIHAGYWTDASKASCFDRLVGIWVPATA